LPAWHDLGRRTFGTHPHPDALPIPKMFLEIPAGFIAPREINSLAQPDSWIVVHLARSERDAHRVARAFVVLDLLGCFRVAIVHRDAPHANNLCRRSGSSGVF